MTLIIRRFVPADAVALTDLLHGAYAELGAMGLNFTAVDQAHDVTLARASAGASWVVEGEPGLIGGITVADEVPDSVRGQAPDVAVPARGWLNQLAVHPRHRGVGLARALRDIGYRWCIDRGVTSIGLDTAEPAAHLIDLYSAWGFEHVGTAHWDGKRYRSVLMAREIPGRP